MENKISNITVSQLPEYLRGSAPLLVAFIDTYYKYVEARTNPVGMIQNRALDVDIDHTHDSYISEFYDTYGEYFPTSMAYDRRHFVKLLNEVYDSKGTEKALKLIFRALFNEEINIFYPSVQMLRASDGVWEREKFITLQTQFGDVFENESKFTFTNQYGDYVIDSSRITKVDDTVRVFFNSYSVLNVVDDQVMFVHDLDGALVYVGKLLKSPTSLEIIDGGDSWQIGQVIIVPGVGANTIARVTSIDANGAITGTEILEYGNHSENQTLSISPYKYKPSGSTIDITKVLTGTNPDVYTHTIQISDYIDGVEESIVGVSDAVSGVSYFLEDYVERGYNGSTVIAYVSYLPQNSSITQDTGLTIEEWLSSRATLSYSFSNLVNTKGYFKDDRGQLSNQFIRLQDNYYYQAFSYVIETLRDIREYRNILNITHPAGTKRFSNLVKLAQCKFEFDVTRTLSNDTMYFLDNVSSSDTLNKILTKPVSDNVTLTETLTRGLNKPVTDTVSVTSDDNASVVSSAGYDLGTYFAEDYSAIDTQLQIG